MYFEPKSRTEWLRERFKGIGGSDAGAAIGVNKYKSNVDLYKEKTGMIKPADISSKPAVLYGKLAEEHLRALFALDFPEYKIDYHEFGMYFSDELPFMYATLDGEITTSDNKHGVLEIKTCTVQSSNQWREWDNRIPDAYYVQVLHQLVCTGFDFAILKAYLRYYKGDDICATVRHYHINASDVQPDMEWLKEHEKEFWESVESRKEPALILPKI